MCGKVCYATREDAYQARSSLAHRKRNRRRRLSVYACPFCNAWHLGRWRLDRPPVRRVRA